MWPFKPFMPKEQSGLEGRSVVVGNLKLHIRNVIAEGGFSCVYHARDAVHSSKQYAVKHIICNDQESLELILKEISVMKSLKGHPNIVSLLAHTILDMGRTKEALLVMEFCEKSLVSVLESRGAGYFEEKQVFSIFRDVCNAVFAMHCQSPPIAHRDLKAENLLLGPDGIWKLCDFGSTSTNHKRFERPEEMGIEEDNIRKHTTPAYRAPEMWDLYRREIISEKVDIWALGCLLYRISYFKSAFDGESKLQILNGNYRIPDLPKYGSSMTDLIRDMLQSSPDARPDITQVWFRVNEQLPVELQKSLPDRSPEMLHAPASDIHEGISNPANRAPPMPHRSPPPPPSKEQARTVSPGSLSSSTGGSGSPLGAFWSSQHADSAVSEDKVGPVFDEEPTSQSTTKQDLRDPRNLRPENATKFVDGPSKDFEITFFPKDGNQGAEKTKASQPENVATFQNQAFNTFVAEFDTSKYDPRNSTMKLVKEEQLEAEMNRLKEQLKQTNLEKAQITSKYEKLSAICRSQRQEIQELKKAHAAAAARTPSLNRDASSKNHSSSPGTGQSMTTPPREKIEGTVWELQQAMFTKNSLSPDTKAAWQAFPEEPKPQVSSKNVAKAFPEEPKPQVSSKNVAKSVRTNNGHQTKQASSALNPNLDAFGFGTDGFTAVPGNAQISRSPGNNNSQRFVDDLKGGGESKPASQPAGWAGF